MQQWVLGHAHGDQRDLTQALKSCSQLPPDRSVREGMTAGDTALYIYTSGTTGLPKAARITHVRAQLYMRGFAGATGATEKDRVYITLPLYHATGGLCAMGAGLLNGGSVVLKKKFSASHFWDDVAAEGCTMFVYIGELCRYLVNCPPNEDETKHKLRLAFGNGLRADVWPDFQKRFRIPEILEFYGSTEGNVSLFNFDGKQGAIGRVPSFLKSQINIRLVQFDVDTEQPVRGPDGLCRPVRVGEVGEAIGLIGNDIRHDFSGYADKSASQKKILTDVFKKGDRWFRTGDLMKQDKEGYFYFVDRMGDTFRWKGENVSTSEVEQALVEAPGVEEAIVYGVPVPGQDGKAGMAALVVEGKFDGQAFSDYVEAKLPAYAQPVFVRLIKAAETTGTFKYRKADLVADGFDPTKTGTALYVRGGKTGYQKLTQTARKAILSGETRL